MSAIRATGMNVRTGLRPWRRVGSLTSGPWLPMSPMEP